MTSPDLHHLLSKAIEAQQDSKGAAATITEEPPVNNGFPTGEIPDKDTILNRIYAIQGRVAILEAELKILQELAEGIVTSDMPATGGLPQT